ncbi:hypothetical protein ACFLR1_00530 [Bacteroidota bacterium]
MKLLLQVLLSAAICTNLFAQAPNKMNYQGVAHDVNGNVLTNQNIGLRFSILSSSISGPVVYAETQTATTNDVGLFNTQIGNGTPTSGTFSSIDWGSTSHFVKVEMDATGGTSYVLMGTSELLSVPYALYAEKSGDVGTLGQGFESHYGTGTSQFFNPTDNEYASINGLDEIEINLPEDMTVIFHTNGNASLPYWNAWAGMQIALFIDGVKPENGAEQYLDLVTDDNITGGGSIWSFTYPVSLSSGLHTVSVKARSIGSQNQGSAGISNNSLYYPKPTLQIIYLKQ